LGPARIFINDDNKNVEEIKSTEKTCKGPGVSDEDGTSAQAKIPSEFVYYNLYGFLFCNQFYCNNGLVDA